jgi:hypothetical protein
MLIVSFDIGIINLCVCIIHNYHIISWKIIKLLEKCPKHIPISLLSSNIYINMDALIDEIKLYTSDKIDFVLLENQPMKCSNNIKITQLLIYGYFYNLKHYDGYVNDILQISPSIKLKEYYKDKDRSNMTKTEQYKQNKTVSIDLCLENIKHSERLLELFNINKKKDDMADSLLMLLAWNKINNKHNIVLLE